MCVCVCVCVYLTVYVFMCGRETPCHVLVCKHVLHTRVIMCVTVYPCEGSGARENVCVVFLSLPFCSCIWSL